MDRPVTSLPERPPTIPVLFACDLNYLQHTAACIASLLENNPVYRFDVLVVGTESFQPVAEKFTRSFEGNPRIDLRLQTFELPTDIGFPLHFHYTLETYIRFWIGDLLKPYDRALYLDPDVIVTGDIGPLWNADLQGRTVAAVPIPGSSRPEQHGMPPGSLYFNAGVILFDLAAWRTRSYREKCLKLLSESPEKAFDSDQDILNLCLQNDWVPLEFKWNVISAFYFPWHDLKLSPDAVEQIRREALIIHFNGGTKPWSYTSEHPRREDYWKYLRLTGWRDARPDDLSLRNVARKLFTRSVPKPVQQAIRSIVR
jgi:lipopolysaccharide biosynthesis glycosyltransferase